MKIVWTSVLLCIGLVNVVLAQESVTQETSPAGMKWYQINTDHFRVLFPEGFDEQANRVANTLEHIREPEAASLGVKPRKISLLLHSQSSVSNGFVTLAPRRSEFYAMPPQNYNFSGTNEWLTLLSSHEYRHIVQFQKSITGFNKGIYFLFGQLAQAGMAFVAVPQWFWEGDAVATETAFTHSGRGRIPEFDLLFRTNFLANRNFNYHKQYLRSYKNNVPNHYVLGYHMVSYLRKKTGNPDIWGDITKRAWNVPFIPFTFSNAIKKETGLYVTQLYDEMAADLKKEWSQQLEGLEFTSFETVNKRITDTYTDYLYPQPLADGRVLVLKSGIGDIQQFVTLDANGNEERHFTPGPVNDAGMLSAAGEKIVWNEYRFDPRWLTRSYSIIKGYDINKDQKDVIVKHSRYSSATLSPDETKVATVETTASYQNQLVVLDYVSGEVVKRFDNPDNHLLTMPRWSIDGTYIVFIELTKEGKEISRYNYTSGQKELLLKTGDENVGHPVLYKDYLLYNSPISGIDNVYAMDLNSKKRYQVTCSKFGAYNPAVSLDGNTIFYNNQTKDGFDVVRVPFQPEKWKAIEDINQAASLFGETLAEQEGQPDLMKSIPNKNYSSRRYHRAVGMINPHSWGVYTNSSFNTLDFGISSKDIMSTTILDLGYRYDVTERTGFWRANLSYQGMYPIFDLEFTHGSRSGNEDYVLNNQEETINFDWKETKVEGGLRIPLVTTQGKFSSRVSIGNSVGLTHVTDFRNDVDGAGRFLQIDTTGGFLFRNYVDNGNLVFNHVSFQADHLLKRSRRDIFSKWGQSVSVDLFTTPYKGSDYTGNQFSVLSTLYFPGLFKHHSLWGFWGYQHTLIEQKIDSYYFRNQVPSPRGLSVSRFQNYYTMSANYTLPLFYPDLAIGPVLNIQRIRGNAFVDHAYGQSPLFNVSRNYTSVGGELKFDVNVLRLLQQFNFGVRYSYGIEPKTTQVEFIIGNIGF